MLRRALLGLLVAVVALAAAEGALRAIYSEEALLFEWERPDGLIETSRMGGIAARPDTVQSIQDGPYTWYVRSEKLGFREATLVPRERPAGTYRVLALGDSWMFGYSVDQGKTIPDRLEALLPEALGVARVEVLNAAVFGSSAFDMLARYRQIVDAFEIDAVLLGTPHNTVRFRAAAAERAAWYQSAHDRPASAMRTYLLVRRWLAPLRSGMYAVPPEGDEGEAQRADIRLLVADARDRGLPVWFIEMPNNWSQSSGGRFDGLVRWRSTLEPLGVLTSGHALGERACWGFEDLAHPSEAGAAAIAARMAEVVKAGRSIPVGATPTCAESPGVGPGKDGWAWVD